MVCIKLFELILVPLGLILHLLIFLFAQSSASFLANLQICYYAKRVNANDSEGIAATSWETFVFIDVLVLFALFAATWVLYAGLQYSQRSKFRLACIMIITSVVAPELLMQLCLAITISLGALVRSMVFCMEPFRISFAGKLDVVCFDKTGILTKDEMVSKGVVASLSSFHKAVVRTKRKNWIAIYLYRVCHRFSEIDCSFHYFWIYLQATSLEMLADLLCKQLGHNVYRDKLKGYKTPRRYLDFRLFPRDCVSEDEELVSLIQEGLQELLCSEGDNPSVEAEAAA
eukprot:gene1819-1990_t